MVKTRLFSRVKAAIVGAAMIATTLITPAMLNTSIATAATDPDYNTPHTFVTDSNEDSTTRKGNINLPSSAKNAKTITFNFTSTYKGSVSLGVYGWGISKDPYWYSYPGGKSDEKSATCNGSSFSVTVNVPADVQGYATKVGMGIWWPQDGEKITLESITADGSATVDPGKPEIPTSENDKSGTWSFVDNKDGTATITATLSAQYREDPSDPASESFDYLLTQGTDEEQYYPYKDEDGNDLPKMQEGDPINSHKFIFTNFGIDDLKNIKFQSFQYTIQSDDYDMSTIQYGGGINVTPGSPADTEYQKGKNGYWYNDQGTEDMEGTSFEINDVHGAYEATNCGGYADIVWDVPKSVQEYIDYSGASNSVGFQYWWGKDDTKEGTNEDGEPMNYTVIPELHLTGCVATYTRSMTVPYTDTIKASSASKTLKAGDSAEYALSDLNLGDRDKVSAIKITFNTASEFTKFICGTGISVDDSKVQEATGVNNGWYEGGNIVVLNNGPKPEIMWIIPDYIRDGIYTKDEGKVQVGFWYAGNGEKEISSASITDVTYYVFKSQEKDIKIVDDNGLKVPDEIQLSVGDTYPLTVNVDGCEFTSDRENVASVDSNGVIEALDSGLAIVTVTTPEGQEKTITVRVTGSKITTGGGSQGEETTTTTTSDPVDPDQVVDWSKVLWGDVNVDETVNVSDAVVLSKYTANKVKNPLKNATAYENANVEYDDAKGDSADLLKLVEYTIKKLSLDDLGPQDSTIRAKATLYKNIKA